MESNHHSDQFESFLREKADDFRMYPSRRIWYSIYNNMHPGNRLPSISMCIVLLFSLLLIGYLNTGNTRNEYASSSRKVAVTTAAASSNPVVTAEPIPFPFVGNAATTIYHFASNSQPATTSQLKQPVARYSAERHARSRQFNFAAHAGGSVSMQPTAAATGQLYTTADFLSTANDQSRKEVVSIVSPDHTASITAASIATTTLAGQTGVNATSTNPDRNDKATLAPASVEEIIGNASAETKAAAETSEADINWMEQYAMYNRPEPKKWAGKLSLLTYITASVVYRTLESNVLDKPRLNGAPLPISGNVENYVDHKPSFGIEAGVAMQYRTTRRLKLKAGAQLNFTRYNAHAYDNYHPLATLITMNNGYPYEVYATTPFTNSFGIAPTVLHNETLQFSLPVGADFRLAAVDNVEWYAGATLQPTVLLYGKSYIISSDRKSYVNDPGLLNRFNLNAGLETYLSIKTGKGYTWQVGPQFRKQLFSTNTRTYSIEERLLSYGFKVGISKKL